VLSEGVGGKTGLVGSSFTCDDDIRTPDSRRLLTDNWQSEQSEQYESSVSEGEDGR
jgi:hypothetical protein